MSHRHYVLVSLDMPDHFTKGASPEVERREAAEVVSMLLRGALAKRNIDGVLSAVSLASDDIDRITLALHTATAHGVEGMRALDAKWKVLLPELRAAIDRVQHHDDEATTKAPR